MNELLDQANRLVENVRRRADVAASASDRSALRIAEGLARSLCDELQRAADPRLSSFTTTVR